MSFVLKERICPLLIKLFSPSTKLKVTPGQAFSQTPQLGQSASQGSSNDQKNVVYFSIVSRLIRIVFVLIKNYFELLVTETEIFLSLLTKFLDSERPLWQKALAIEAFHKISVETRIIELLVINYDMKQHPEKIFSLITAGIALFIQSLFLNAAASGTQLGAQSTGNASQSSNTNSNSLNSMQQQSNAFAFQISSAQPSFVYKDTTIQLLLPYVSGQVKSTYLDTWDKLDVPYIQDGYLLSVGFATLQELCKSVQCLVEQNISIYQQQASPDIVKTVSPTSPLTTTGNFLSLIRINLNPR